MGLVNSALHIGRSAITSYQSALSIVGNNIANASNPDYSRQRAELDPVLGAPLPQGVLPGGGVALTSLQRIINEGLEERLRHAIGNVEQARIESQTVTQIENSFNELTDNDISTMLTNLFNSFADVQNNPTEVGLRSVAIGNAAALAQTLQARRDDLSELIDEINQQVVAATQQANDLITQVAELNIQIVSAEASGQIAGALRDERDALLRDLGEIVRITVRPQDSGAVSVFVGNETLVQLNTARQLVAQQVVADGTVRMEVRFQDNGGQVDIRGGQLEGLINSRDVLIANLIDDLDQFAAGLIAVANEIHSNGQGLEGYSQLVGTYAVIDADAALNDPAAGLTLVPRTGSLFISVSDVSSGRKDTYRINVDLDGVGGDDTTLNSLVDQINATVANVVASVNPENKLALTAEPGFSFTFGHDGGSNRDDTSNVLSALGINTLFAGGSATDIRVNQTIESRPELFAAAGANFSGDGVNAGALANLGEQQHALLGQATPFEFYNKMLGELAVETAARNAGFESTDSVRLALEQQRASISGVNLDEEAVELLKYERAFQGSARFTTIVDELITELLNIVR